MISVLLAVVALVTNDIRYVDNGDAYRLSRCRLDVKWPQGATGFPTVVWLHGGGLTTGNRHFIAIDDAIAQVAVNYRLMNATNAVRGADCITDAAAAVAWTFRHISAFGGDPKNIYLAGMSAGGYLTMMVGMAPKYLGEQSFKPTDLAGIVPISGQATKHFAVRQFEGDRDPQFQPKVDDLAPLRWVSKDVPPILSICGEPPWEWKGRSEENRLLVASCTALGHPSAQFMQIPYCDHGRVYNGAIPFVELYVKGRMPRNLVAR